MPDLSLMLSLPPWAELSGLGFAALLAVAVLAGAARGLTGFGSGLIFIPLAAIFVGPKQAAALLLMTDLIGGLPTVAPSWREADRRPVFVMVAGAVIGVPLGLMTLLLLDPTTVRWSISILVLLLLALLVSGWRWRGATPTSAIATAGGIGGFLSGLAQIGGPPIVAFWLGLPRPLPELRANIMLYFTLTSVISMVVYSLSGLISWGTIALSACVLPTYTAGVLLGMRLFPLTDPKLFRKIVLGLIGLAALLGMPIWNSTP